MTSDPGHAPPWTRGASEADPRAGRPATTTPEGLYLWSASGLRRGTEEAGTKLLAADSWLVSEGRARTLDRHRERFLAACRASRRGTAEADEDIAFFWTAAITQIPRGGSWFPRIELVDLAGHRRLRVRIRPAPPLGTGVRVWGAPVPDPRTRPRVKGPDLDRLADLRRAAGDQGADEALLATRSGLIVEAATSSICWWEGDALCVPDLRFRALPGITIGLVLERARRIGLEIRPSRRRVEELAGREVWLLNALHGIRPVTSWVGTALEAGPAVRSEQWQRWLTGLVQALPTSRVQDPCGDPTRKGDARPTDGPMSSAANGPSR
ncbi:aminotransferase class IV [Parafrankia sp. EUN1f]|uniref:aminotransferase class IV n=1 Tax=Parafrankia sp. EUN1f TaxID=102897 RepID=UPI0001C44631|nr:aminotransferase class IV [Parafrankia sp. EUN1f]EFC85486.1 aminotransferase class IV [Parafrankia sp. EUN1f]